MPSTAAHTPQPQPQRRQHQQASGRFAQVCGEPSACVALRRHRGWVSCGAGGGRAGCRGRSQRCDAAAWGWRVRAARLRSPGAAAAAPAHGWCGGRRGIGRPLGALAAGAWLRSGPRARLAADARGGAAPHAALATDGCLVARGGCGRGSGAHVALLLLLLLLDRLRHRCLPLLTLYCFWGAAVAIGPIARSLQHCGGRRA